MIGGQTQKGGEGSEQRMAGRDYHEGMTVDQVGALMSHISTIVRNQIEPFMAQANKLVDERLGHFQQKIEHMVHERDEVHMDAFADPDFQVILRQAAQNYTRSGDEELAEMLLNMIATRSQLDKPSRARIAMNMALDAVPRLTQTEFAIILTVFLIRYTTIGSVAVNELGKLFRDIIGDSLPIIPPEANGASWMMINAAGCGVVSVASIDLHTVFCERFAGLFSKGFTIENISTIIKETKIPTFFSLILKNCTHVPDRAQFNVLSIEELENTLRSNGLPSTQISELVNLVKSTTMSISEMASTMRPEFPGIDLLIHLCKSTPLAHLELTTTGIAVGHASFVRRSQVKVPLTSWIS